MADELGWMEFFWRDSHPWLKSMGYELRPRFRLGWIPSWITDSYSTLWEREDHIQYHKPRLMNVIRIRDGKQFMLKRVPKLP
ncbi:hypothetical protein CPB84DRAFT_1778291 [Gymnopilus junonius]|uniref:Uncharacterized protein n=1 Tax=Gymnopilus junonius TaxID=109634 RepID=A0A9P5TN81_GYMJU|nr:hypothetical protein CPB84DRAFT_1778291 [Gymnopilus junonius]